MNSRISAVAGLALAAALAFAAQAGAGGTTLITVEDDVFDPVTVTENVALGGVRWEWNVANDNEHNVVQDRKLFNSGPPAIVDDDFPLDPSAGTFPYYCAVHGSKGGAGMSGKLRIRPRTEIMRVRGIEPQFGVIWAPESLQSGDRFDVRYRVNDGNWKSWKKNTKKRSGAFGDNGNPVTVKPNKTYEVQARSKDSSNLKKRKSGWSPSLELGISG